MQIKINTQLIDWAIERSAKSVEPIQLSFYLLIVHKIA
jgi:hypothetical protein